MQALCLIAERLAQLHGSGWVHRDLKPGNVLRLPGQHSWTLMDFGCAARCGTLRKPTACSPCKTYTIDWHVYGTARDN